MRIPFLLIGLLAMASCKLEVPSVYEARFSSDPTITPVAPGQIDEASGMADSRSMPGNLWIQQDSGSPAELVLLGYDGKVKGRVNIPNFQNRDWEDMAIGPGPQDGVNYIYLADIGDNTNQNVISQIYRMPEPANLQTPITNVERINFRYPDGPRDAEAMFVDPQTKDIYIITKREIHVRLYRLPYPQNINEVTVAEYKGELPQIGTTVGLPNYVTGAAISPDGLEIMVRTYTQILYWKRNPGQGVVDALIYGFSRQMPYRLEPQGEAVCFSKDNRGYFTISERASASSVNLYFYARQ